MRQRCKSGQPASIRPRRARMPCLYFAAPPMHLDFSLDPQKSSKLRSPLKKPKGKCGNGGTRRLGTASDVVREEKKRKDPRHEEEGGLA